MNSSLVAHVCVFKSVRPGAARREHEAAHAGSLNCHSTGCGALRFAAARPNHRVVHFARRQHFVPEDDTKSAECECSVGPPENEKGWSFSFSQFCALLPRTGASNAKPRAGVLTGSLWRAAVSAPGAEVRCSCAFVGVPTLEARVCLSLRCVAAVATRWRFTAGSRRSPSVSVGDDRFPHPNTYRVGVRARIKSG